MFTLHNVDCLEYMKTLAPESIQAVITDPPYGMNWNVNGNRYSKGGKDWGDKIINDDKPFDPHPFLQFKNVVMWGSNHYASTLPKGTTLIWIKRSDKAFGTFLSDAELGYQKGGEGVYCFRDFRYKSETLERYHPTQKPVSLMRWCIERVTKEGDTVFDPFMGSGTTGIACIQTNRNFIGCEISPEYFAIAEKRIKQAAQQPNFFTPSNNRVQRTGGESAANLSLFPAEVQPPAKVTRQSTRR